MKKIVEPAREVPVLAEADVVVVGGGPGGVGAALAAARTGAKAIIIERFGFFGGSQTLTGNPSFTYVDEHIQGGIVKEIMDNLIRSGETYNDTAGGRRDHWSHAEGCIYFSTEYYKFLLNNLMEDAGVKMLFYSDAVSVLKEGRLIKGVIIETLEGRRAILAKSVVDATGYAKIAWLAGASVMGDEGFPDDKYGPFKGKHSAFGYGFIIRGLDYQKFCEFSEKPENVEEWGRWIKGRETYARAKQEGRIYSQRSSVCFAEFENGRVWMLGPNYQLPDGRHMYELEMISKAEVDLRKQAWSVYSLLKSEVPGFEKTTIEHTAARLLIRDARRVVGDYILSENDMNEGKSFDDSIACSNMSPDLMLPDNSQLCKYSAQPHDIPYRCVVSKDYDNLLAAGQNCSYDFYVWAADRYCAPGMCVGQAAGTAAALAAQKGVTPKQVDVKEVQESLRKQGMVTSNKEVDADILKKYARRRDEWDSFGF